MDSSRGTGNSSYYLDFSDSESTTTISEEVSACDIDLDPDLIENGSEESLQQINMTLNTMKTIFMSQSIRADDHVSPASSIITRINSLHTAEDGGISSNEQEEDHQLDEYSNPFTEVKESRLSLFESKLDQSECLDIPNHGNTAECPTLDNQNQNGTPAQPPTLSAETCQDIDERNEKSDSIDERSLSFQSTTLECSQAIEQPTPDILDKTLDLFFDAAMCNNEWSEAVTCSNEIVQKNDNIISTSDESDKCSCSKIVSSTMPVVTSIELFSSHTNVTRAMSAFGEKASSEKKQSNTTTTSAKNVSNSKHTGASKSSENATLSLNLFQMGEIFKKCQFWKNKYKKRHKEFKSWNLINCFSRTGVTKSLSGSTSLSPIGDRENVEINDLIECNVECDADTVLLSPTGKMITQKRVQAVAKLHSIGSPSSPNVSALSKSSSVSIDYNATVQNETNYESFLEQRESHCCSRMKKENSLQDNDLKTEDEDIHIEVIHDAANGDDVVIDIKDEDETNEENIEPRVIMVEIIEGNEEKSVEKTNDIEIEAETDATNDLKISIDETAECKTSTSKTATIVANQNTPINNQGDVQPVEQVFVKFKFHIKGPLMNMVRHLRPFWTADKIKNSSKVDPTRDRYSTDRVADYRVIKIEEICDVRIELERKLEGGRRKNLVYYEVTVKASDYFKIRRALCSIEYLIPGIIKFVCFPKQLNSMLPSHRWPEKNTFIVRKYNTCLADVKGLFSKFKSMDDIPTYWESFRIRSENICLSRWSSSENNLDKIGL